MKQFFRDKKKNAFLILGSALLIVIVIQALLTPLFFSVEQIEVSGHAYLSSKEVITASNIQIGQALFPIRSEEVVANLKLNAWVREASVTKVFPNTLQLVIEEREPIIALPYQKSFAIVGRDGIAIAIRSDFSQVNLPVLNGYIPTSIRVGEEVISEALWGNLTGIFINCSADILCKVSEIYWQEDETILHLNTGLKIVLGDIKDFDPERLKMLPDILGQIPLTAEEGFLDMRGVNTVYRKNSIE